MRLPASAHTSRPWRIHDLAPEFRVEDVWQLPTPGGPDDFPRLLEGFATADPSRSGPAVVRALFALRWQLGALLGWDAPDTGVSGRVAPVRQRLPEDLRGSADAVRFESLPFTPLYLLADEFAAETANRTMHGILHLGWVADGRGGYRGQMAVLVDPNGALGHAYMVAIRPVRHLLVYPTLLRQIDRRWRQVEVAS